MGTGEVWVHIINRDATSSCSSGGQSCEVRVLLTGAATASENDICLTVEDMQLGEVAVVDAALLDQSMPLGNGFDGKFRACDHKDYNDISVYDDGSFYKWKDYTRRVYVTAGQSYVLSVV